MSIKLVKTATGYETADGAVRVFRIARGSHWKAEKTQGPRHSAMVAVRKTLREIRAALGSTKEQTDRRSMKRNVATFVRWQPASIVSVDSWVIIVQRIDWVVLKLGYANARGARRFGWQYTLQRGVYTYRDRGPDLFGYRTKQAAQRAALAQVPKMLDVEAALNETTPGAPSTQASAQ